ncbi:hypothetical protein ACSV5S_12085 [Agrobacterium deltaense]|uniref:hypothetical protein n=1 Tax=Agrobacterium deltaense TaxID=1183412 RepID=UPI003FD4CA70
MNVFNGGDSGQSSIRKGTSAFGANRSAAIDEASRMGVSPAVNARVAQMPTTLDGYTPNFYFHYYVNVKVMQQSSGCLTIDWRATCFAAIEARQRRPALRRQALVDAVSRMAF